MLKLLDIFQNQFLIKVEEETEEVLGEEDLQIAIEINGDKILEKIDQHQRVDRQTETVRYQMSLLSIKGKLLIFR